MSVAEKDSEPPKRRLALLIANPATKGNIPTYVAAVRAAAPPSVDVWVRYTRRGDYPLADVADIIDDADLLIAVGGDGTVATVADLAMARQLPLAIIPAGSTNIVARDLGIPSDPSTAANLIFGNHRERLIDLGRCNDRWFLHMGGSGIDSKLFMATDQARKRRYGWKAYVGPAIRNLFSTQARYTLTTEFGSLSVMSPLILVALGGALITPEIKIASGISRDDGLLDVFVFTPSNSTKLVDTGLRLISRQIEASPYVTRIRCTELLLEADPEMPVEIDGDVTTHTPAHFTISPLALNVIVPK
jgi:diacylglycerol kinase family enzyme